MNQIEQSIYHGSVHEALLKNFITCHDILKYLLEKPFDVFRMIAYRAVCQFDKNQIINDKPFVCQTEVDNYVAVYALSVTDPIGRTPNETFEIFRRIQNVLPKIFGQPGISTSIPLICDFPDSKFQDNSAWLFIAARSTKLIVKHLEKIKREHAIWMLHDYLEPLRNLNYKQYENDLIRRCNMLIEKAPLYWVKVALPLYRDLVSNNIDVNKLNKDQMKQYKYLFPELILDELLNMSEFKSNMKQLPEISQAYVLGYPIHKYLPSAEVLNKTISYVESIGIDKYAEELQIKNMKFLESHLDVPLNHETKIGNTTDVLTEDISSYNTFDVIRCYIDTHVYYFTRAEFPKIMERRKNLWTNEPLPLPVMIEISNRLEMDAVLKLPKAEPIKDLLKKVETGTIEKEPELPRAVLNPLPRLENNQHEHERNRHEYDGSEIISIDNNLLQHLIENHVCPRHAHVCPRPMHRNEDDHNEDEISYSNMEESGEMYEEM